MAKATINRPAPVPPPTTITLELTEDEARYLSLLLGTAVIGWGGSDVRDLNSSIWWALKEAIRPVGTSHLPVFSSPAAVSERASLEELRARTEVL